MVLQIIVERCKSAGGSGVLLAGRGSSVAGPARFDLLLGRLAMRDGLSLILSCCDDTLGLCAQHVLRAFATQEAVG